VVRPGDAAQVQAVVAWANRTGTPVIPASSGPPHLRGGTCPAQPGTVVIDLTRLKKIHRIDGRNKLALIEPGVTFGELRAAAAGEGLCPYMPLAPRANKSVIASVLEREPVTMPSHHWDSTDPLLCAEVVFGTGDRFRTGEASGPDTIQEQWEVRRVQMNPFGHSHVDFQRLMCGAQGTMGIVTWTTVKLCYASVTHKAFLIPSDNLSPLLDFIYQPLKYRLGGKLFILNNITLACLLGKNPAEIAALRKDLPPWAIFVSFEGYGVLPEEKIAYEEADFRKMAQACNLTLQDAAGGAAAEALYRILAAPPAETYWKTGLKGGVSETLFLTTIDKAGAFCDMVAETARAQDYPGGNIGVYLQPIVQGTSCHVEFDLYYNPSDRAESAATAAFTGVITEKIAAMGGFFSRPYAAYREIAYRNAGATREMQKKIKNIFDPAGIMNPGKLGF
jgi:FAD/FMN-containing dehydrogenase